MAKVPAKPATGTVRFPDPSIEASRPHTSSLDTAPTFPISCHIPDSRSPAWRVRSITANSNRENARESSSHHQYRQHECLAGVDGDAGLEEPQVHLRRSSGVMYDTVSGVDADVLGADGPHPVF